MLFYLRLFKSDHSNASPQKRVLTSSNCSYFHSDSRSDFAAHTDKAHQQLRKVNVRYSLERRTFL